MEDKQFDPSMNILRRPYKDLDYFFSPKKVAVIGASEREGSVGKTILFNLLKTPFGGTIYPVNPKRDSVLGLKAYPSVSTIPDQVELAIIVTPAKSVPNIIEECAKCNIPAAIVISAGFKELGEPGLLLEKEIMEKKGKMRLIGPNCLGVMNPISGLNATFAADMALKGNIAFISQSGALLTAVLDWSLSEQVGFSSVVSIGSMADVSWGDLISYFGSDESTKSILIYMESIGDPRAFLSAAREVALTKPIILIKAGKTEESKKAAASHTGSLAGSDDVLNAALRRVGVLRVDTISDLFSMAQLLSKQPLPKGPNLTIITNAGGPGVIATDALIQNHGALTVISEKSTKAFDELLPPHWSHNNPIDILGDASPEVYGKSVEIVSSDENSHGILVILTPQDMTDPTRCAAEVAKFSKLKKPLFASWMGGKIVAEGNHILTRKEIATFEYPDEACKAFAYMWRYSYNLKGIYETPSTIETLRSPKEEKLRREEINQIVEEARKEKRKILTEYESKRIVELYDIPVVKTYIAKTTEEALKYAEKIGFPVVLKLYSKTITHKTDVGGVKLNLQSRESTAIAFQEIQGAVDPDDFDGVTVQPMVRLKGYEIILGSSMDPQFGPTILFGSGGELVEVYQDRSLGLPPLTTTLAKRMMEQTKIYKALQGVRGKKSIDFQQLEKILVQFSFLIAEEEWIEEFDINPLLVSEEGMIALDARVILSDQNTKRKLAIRPYPKEYIEEIQLKKGESLFIRPILPEDEPRVVQFHQELSQETVRQRYLKQFHYDERVQKERLHRICFNDYDREIALVAFDHDKVVGMVRLSKIPGSNRATFSMMIIDSWHGKGLGSYFLGKIIEIARKEHVEKLYAEHLQENEPMQRICEKAGFSVVSKADNRLIVELDL